MADEAKRKSATDLMAEINAVRRHQYTTFNIADDITCTVVLFVFDTEDCLNVVYHDVRQPLIPYVMPWADFVRIVAPAPLLEQTENA